MFSLFFPLSLYLSLSLSFCLFLLPSSPLSLSGLNVINTNCSAAHTRQALCCKMSVEYDKFIESQKKFSKTLHLSVKKAPLHTHSHTQ